jgi:predicted Zn finger-like uncharacterized protein
MAETQITRCPHCQTTFRIRSEQLAKANGAVRCGSCLQVFKAGENLVSNNPNLKKTELKPEVKAEPEAKPEPTTNKVSEVEAISFDDIPDQIDDDPLEDFGIRQPDRDTSETFESALKLDDSIFSMQESTKPSRYSLLDSDNNDFDNHFDNDNEVVDDSWATSLIDDEETSSSEHNKHDESWADALLDVDDDLVEDIDSGFTKANTATEKDDFVPSLNDHHDDDQFHLGGDDQFDQETIEIELNVTDSVNDLLDEPLSFNHKGKKKKPKVKVASYTLWWFAGSIMMIIAATAQIGYFKFDSWSRHPDYRPAYTFICELADCQLPAIQDVSKISTQHFMVRLHPDVEKALYIDTLLVNNADYQQPFPDLNLIFTGLENEVIASRLFKPKEYLAGELAGATVMPLNIPIHIAFEITNPGAEAVSYRIELVANH